MLTTGADMIVGGAANDSVNAIIGAGDTLTALDSIDGGEGSDTVNVLDMAEAGSALPAGITVKNVENVSLRSVGEAKLNISAWAGVEKLSVTQAVKVNVTAAATTAVAVSGATGDIKTTGGSTVNVASATAAQKVEVEGSKGAVTVAATKGAGDIKVDGGTDVTVSSSEAAAGKIEIGQTTASTGAISVTSTGATYVAVTAATLGAIKAKGGTTVNVTQTATSDATAAAKDVAAAAVTQGAVTVNGGDKTTTVTVKQDAAATAANAVVAVAGVKQVDTVTFADAISDAAIVVGGLTFTTAKALTAAEVAAAFANLSAGAVHGSAPTSKGIYTGTFSATYNTGAVTTTGSVITVEATAKAATTGNTAIAATGPTSANKTAGVTAVEAVAGKMGVVGGKVVVDGAALTTVSLDGYGAASTVTSNKLASLSLANSAAGLTVTNTVATTLALAVNNLGATSTLDLGATYTTLNITADGKDSAMVLTAAGVKTLNLAGTKSVDFKTSALTATETVTVTGSAGATFDAATAANLKSVDTTGTTGAVTAKLDASKATYTGGAGVDTVTLAATSVTKAVNTGAGNDSVQLAAGTTALTAAVSGGEGTDELVMEAADAAAASAATTFEAKIDGFEILALNTVSATTLVNLDNLDEINHVITQGGTKDLTLDKMLNNATVELLGANTDALGLTVKLKDATGTSDVVNLVADAAETANVNIGLVTVAGVETINLSAMSAKVDTLTLTAAAATTVNVTGKGNLDLALTGSTKVTLVDGSAATGKLVVATAGAVASTVKGGAGDDTLTAKGNGDTLLGGAGADTLKVMGNLVTLTGGAGADSFDVSNVTANVNSYATITDLSAGDLIKFSGGALDFLASKVELASTAVFQDYANAAINLTDTGDVSWFQFGGNTYVLENVSNAASFNNSSDIIVKITGAVDLSTAAFSSSADTLLIA